MGVSGMNIFVHRRNFSEHKFCYLQNQTFFARHSCATLKPVECPFHPLKPFAKKNPLMALATALPFVNLQHRNEIDEGEVVVG